MRRNTVHDGRDDPDGEEQFGPQVLGGDGEAVENLVKRNAMLGQHGRQLRERTDALRGRGRGNGHVAFVPAGCS
jgi:hypothetical protein